MTESNTTIMKPESRCDARLCAPEMCGLLGRLAESGVTVQAASDELRSVTRTIVPGCLKRGITEIAGELGLENPVDSKRCLLPSHDQRVLRAMLPDPASTARN